MSTNAYLVRFNLSQRIEHLLTMVIFTLLCLTGLPLIWVLLSAHAARLRKASPKPQVHSSAQ